MFNAFPWSNEGLQDCNSKPEEFMSYILERD